MKPKTHTLGLPSLGPGRELKKNLEAFWKGKITLAELKRTGAMIRDFYREEQGNLGVDDRVLGDFTFYDRVLDLCGLFGLLSPETDVDPLQKIFHHARGHAERGIQPALMTKWFDTNYHYFVPFQEADWRFSLQKDFLELRLSEVQGVEKGFSYTLIGPLSFFYLIHPGGGFDIALGDLELLQKEYQKFLDELRRHGANKIYLEEPILVLDPLPKAWKQAFSGVYSSLGGQSDILVSSYFGALEDNLELLCSLPIRGIHLDFRRNLDDMDKILDRVPQDWILSLGVVDARSPWREDAQVVAQELKRSGVLTGREVFLAPDASLQFLPWTLSNEQPPQGLDKDLAFAKEKLQTLVEISSLLDSDLLLTEGKENGLYLPWLGRGSGNWDLQQTSDPPRRPEPWERRRIQSRALGLDAFPVTTIGSFPQTPQIRRQRNLHRRGLLSDQAYEQFIQEEIRSIIQQQEEIGLDVLVHGEPERTDMVSFFTEFIGGIWQPENGWVRSYGSRCVRPPVIHSTPTRLQGLGTKWILWAQSLTARPVKGMLTGPVTLTKWSFTPPFVEQKTVARAFSKVIRQEVLELEKAGIRIIQIDEPAFREILPLKRSKWPETLAWTAGAFRGCFQGIQDQTQIHTHMCYSDFGDIHQAIEAMDADVVSIESSRNRGAVLGDLSSQNLSAALGPGVWDIHTPDPPGEELMLEIIQKAVKSLGSEAIWINPDCGLKTRQPGEILGPLGKMVRLAKSLRKNRAEEFVGASGGSE